MFELRLCEIDFFTKCNDMEYDFMSEKRENNKIVSMQFNNHKSQSL